jgi:hypothetical protein
VNQLIYLRVFQVHQVLAHLIFVPFSWFLCFCSYQFRSLIHYATVLTNCTTYLTSKNTVFCSHGVFKGVVQNKEGLFPQTALNASLFNGDAVFSVRYDPNSFSVIYMNSRFKPWQVHTGLWTAHGFQNSLRVWLHNKICRKQSSKASIRGLYLTMVWPTTVQVTNCCFEVNEKTLRHNLLHKPTLTEVIWIPYVNVTHYGKVRKFGVSP